MEVQHLYKLGGKSSHPFHTVPCKFSVRQRVVKEPRKQIATLRLSQQRLSAATHLKRNFWFVAVLVA